MLSMSIEDLKTTIAHATGYSSSTAVQHGRLTNEFLALQHKASRIARATQHPDTGRTGNGQQGWPTASPGQVARAAAPLIVVKCYNGPPAGAGSRILRCKRPRQSATAGKLVNCLGRDSLFGRSGKIACRDGEQIADGLEERYCEQGTGVRKKLNVRVIAACDSNLKRLADKGLFSRELYELVLNTVIRVPPLRERVKDIEVIATHILAEMSAQHNLPPKRLSNRALQLLTGCSWTVTQTAAGRNRTGFLHRGSIIERNTSAPVTERSKNHGKRTRMLSLARLEVCRMQITQTGWHAGRKPCNFGTVI